MATTTTWVGTGDVRVTNQGLQSEPAAAATPDGGYVLAWIESGTSNGAEFSQLHAQRFDAGGNKVGGEAVLSQGPAYGPPGLAVLADGSFVATWETRSDSLAPTNYVSQHFDGAGAVLGAPVVANAVPDFDPTLPAEATPLAGGGYVLEWWQDAGAGYGPQLQVYGSGGAAVGGSTQLGYAGPNSPLGGNYVHSASNAATSDGGFVAVWATTSAFQPGAGTTDHVFVQRFDASGHATTSPVEAMTQPSSTATLSGVEAAVLAGSGNVVISTRAVLPDGRSGVTAQICDPNGHALGAVQTIVFATEILDSKVTALTDGTFVVSWMDSQTQQQTTLQTVYAQRFDVSGSMLGSQILVGTSQALNAHYAVTATAGGGAEFAWDDGRTDGADVFAQHFGPSASGDTVAPTAVAFSPADAASNVAVNSDITITFSEAIARGTGAIVLHDAAGHVIATYDAASANVTISGATLKIDPTADWAPATGYGVDLAPGAVTDLAGNAYAGESSYDFTTAAGGATPPPAPAPAPPPPAPPPPAPVPGPVTIGGTGGDDVLSAASGNQVIDGGAGTDTVVFNSGLAGVQGVAFANGELTIATAAGTSTMRNIERVQFSDAYFALDTNPGGHVWQAAALWQAAIGTLPGRELLSQWTAAADHAASMGALAQQLLDTYVPGVSSATLVTYLIGQLAHVQPSAATVQQFVDLIGPGKPFANNGELFAAAASLSLNTDHMAAIVGTAQALDPHFFGA